MADFNQVVVDPKTFFLEGKLTLDPETTLTLPRQFDKQSVKTMTVANGATIQVYDVTDPSNPVLIGIIG